VGTSLEVCTHMSRFSGSKHRPSRIDRARRDYIHTHIHTYTHTHTDDSGERISGPRARGVVALRSVRNEHTTAHAYNTYFFFIFEKKKNCPLSFASPAARAPSSLAQSPSSSSPPRVNGLRDVHTRHT